MTLKTRHSAEEIIENQIDFIKHAVNIDDIRFDKMLRDLVLIAQRKIK